MDRISVILMEIALKLIYTNNISKVCRHAPLHMYRQNEPTDRQVTIYTVKLYNKKL